MRASEDAVEDKAQIKVVEIKGSARMEQAWALRRRVFIEEQHVPEEIELDADDARAASMRSRSRAHVRSVPWDAAGCSRMAITSKSGGWRCWPSAAASASDGACWNSSSNMRASAAFGAPCSTRKCTPRAST